ncbi:glycosyltransferase family 2 protein [Aureimonas fodinaquatilis]|uniref:Glycosyltransferase family 2 protein n=1 Tax=Aureimonas fodinaquatilis TaxID=2565783 RepID=A0A5B0DRB0_9HYPH|nr:glycosyltransferase family 2 protein [Aureimonas fodinaquatilis]KAA0969008.1 glycosyltransferase family 2 protein [Aureimonas fodinaquatilis]
MITVSIVSHLHGHMLAPLVAHLLGFAQVQKIVLTLNVPEALELPQSSRITLVYNDAPKGFGANHNAAFRHCETPFFCVLNPDVQFLDNPLPALSERFEQNNVALVAPLVLTPDKQVEDSIRHFPHPVSLLLKALKRDNGAYPLPADRQDFEPDWVAGMFMLFRADDYRRINGFDEGFFLYYEDVDICVRVHAAGRRIVACPSVQIVHAAQRASHSDTGFRKMHLASMRRYFTRDWRRLFAFRLR